MTERPKKVSLLVPGYLRWLELHPKTVIDVGVRNGTPPLYKAFPDAQFILVDPQAGGESLLVHRPAHYVFRNVAVGSAPGRMILNEAKGRSSLLGRTELTAVPIERAHEVEVSTLDALIDEQAASGPMGIKIDTEGFELEALGGLVRHAGEIDFLICEVSVRQRFIGGYTFAELVGAAHQKGFEFFNFLNAPRRRPRFYDCLFLRRGHRLFA